MWELFKRLGLINQISMAIGAVVRVVMDPRHPKRVAVSP